MERTPQARFPHGIAALLCALLFCVSASAKDILRADGCVDKTLFNEEWQRYSDIDERIPLTSRSREAQQLQAALDEIVDARVEIARLETLMELDRQTRLAARDYRKALQQGHKANLLKTFWRMAWITYNTAGGPTGKQEFVDAGADLAELLLRGRPDLPTLGRAAGLVKELVPKQHSSAPGEAGKVLNIGVDARIESLKNAGEPPEKMAVKVVSKIMETAGKEFLPSAELSDEELHILRVEHIELRHLDVALEQSYTVNKDRAAQIEALKAQIKDAENKAKEAKRRERSRVLARLDKDCLKNLKIEVSAPAKIRLGETATVSVKISGGSGDYLVSWFSTKPGDENSPLAVGTQAEGGRTKQYRPGAVGPHLVGVYVYDNKIPDMAKASSGALIDVVATDAAPAPAAPAKPATPAAPAKFSKSRLPPHDLVLLETVTLTGEKEAANTSFATQRGKTYALDVSGKLVRQYQQRQRDNPHSQFETWRDVYYVDGQLYCNDAKFGGELYGFFTFNTRLYTGDGKPIKFWYKPPRVARSDGTFEIRSYSLTGTYTVKVYEIRYHGK